MQEQDRNEITEFIRKTSIPGLLIIEKPTNFDERGWFREPLRLNEIEKAIGSKFQFKQWSHSYSLPGVIRALHSEDQNKIIYPITGKVFSAYVDVRPNLSTFGQVYTLTFKEPNSQAVFIPKGVANSVCVVGSVPVHYLYLIDEYYDPKKIKGIAWDDPDLNIVWPVKKPIISERDRKNPRLRELFPEKFK